MVVHGPPLRALGHPSDAGAFNLYSASNGSALFYSQLKLIPVGLLLFFVTGFWLRPRQLNAHAYWIFGATCLLLAVVLIGGEIGGGSRRWLEFGGFRAQPSELAKITVAIVVARVIATMGIDMSYNLKDLLPVAALVAIAAGLIFPQPDLGTATLLVLIATAQLCFVHIRWKSIGRSDDRRVRPAAHLAVRPDGLPEVPRPDLPQSVTRPARQGLQLVPVSRGDRQRWTYGTGFMNGSQTHLKFLPMSPLRLHFFRLRRGARVRRQRLALLAFTAIAYCALEIARRSKNTFSMLLAVGLGAFVFLEFSINVAMVLRLLPVKGLPLPFMSQGGSNLLTSCLVLGLLVAIDRENRMRTKSSRNDVFKN